MGVELRVGEVATVTLAVDEAARALVVTVEARWFGEAAPPGPPGPAGRRDGLWEHEVVEVFVVGPPHDRSATYVELELSPHGHWLALELAGYRARRRDDVPVAAEAAIDRALGRWRGAMRVALSELPPRPWRVNAFAIHSIEGGAERAYVAATPLGGERPDFHRVWEFTCPVA